MNLASVQAHFSLHLRVSYPWHLFPSLNIMHTGICKILFSEYFHNILGRRLITLSSFQWLYLKNCEDLNIHVGVVNESLCTAFTSLLDSTGCSYPVAYIKQQSTWTNHGTVVEHLIVSIVFSFTRRTTYQKANLILDAFLIQLLNLRNKFPLAYYSVISQTPHLNIKIFDLMNLALTHLFLF